MYLWNKDIDCILNDNDYVDLLNSVQRHTHCSTSYCLKNSVNETELKCRFNFPLEKWEKTTSLFEAIHTKDNRKKYNLTEATKRNDPRHILDYIASSNRWAINHGLLDKKMPGVIQKAATKFIFQKGKNSSELCTQKCTRLEYQTRGHSEICKWRAF